jgi:hypothetical protein
VHRTRERGAFTAIMPIKERILMACALLLAIPAAAQEAAPVPPKPAEGYWDEARECFRERPYWLEDWHSLPFCDDNLLTLDKDLRENKKPK